MSYLTRIFPLRDQLSGYGRDQLQGDLSAGLTVGVMLIPQGMAYALIAGLPPIYGLYASLVPIIVYALFGTSRQLAVGPVAMVSLLVAAGVAPLAGGDAGRYIELALLLALMVGAIQLVLGLARFGFLTNFLSHPVLAGFTSAAALIIGLSQLKHLLGVPIPRSNYIHEILWSALQQIGSVHVPTLLLGLGSIVLLVVLKRWRRIPGPLVVVVLGTLAVWGFGLHERGMAIVGAVPGGLPAPVVPPISLASLEALLPIALTIALVGFMESIAVAKVYATKNRYEVDANRELVGLGLANLIGAFFRSYPVTGGFSRTAVNAQAGAQTTVASLISAGVIALTLLFLTPLFYYLPNAVLAAIVMVAVSGLIDWKEARFLWKTDRRDLALMALTFLATLGLGIEEGILVGVVVSLVLVIQQSSRPHTAVMGRLPNTSTYRNVERYPDALVNSRVAILRMDASLYFANVAYLKEQVEQLVERSSVLQALVLDAYPINRIDSTGAHALKELVTTLRERGIAFYMAGVKGPVMDRLKRAGVADLIGADHFFLDVHAAVEAAEAATGARTAPATSTATLSEA
ncbi:sodium-independent anion transporter [Rhodothermaceae bacterium RA]|nr:sodium-independent anion transporter [Rhodothermaceae bacterium RA]